MDKLQDSMQLVLFLTIISCLLIPTNFISFAQNVNQDSNFNLSRSYSSSTQLVAVSVKTDKSLYSQGDTVNISGKVSQTIPNTDLFIRIMNPSKHLISISSLIPLEDGSFSTMIIAAGTMWTDAGNYNVEIEYGDTQNFITFYFSGGNEQFIVNPIITEIYQLKSGEQVYDIPYLIQGGILKNMELFADNFTLEMNIAAPTNGRLIVTLQRNFIDSQTSDGNDNQFRIVINQNQSSQFIETKNNNLRTLNIPFHVGNTKIDIIGSTLGANVIISKGASYGQDCASSINCLSSSITSINVGTTVLWTNNDVSSHTVTSGRLSDPRTGTIFDSSQIEPGGTYHFKFNNVGLFDYHCQIHPWIEGQIVVSNEISPSVTNSSHMNFYQPITISVATDKSSYKINELATISTLISSSKGQNVALSIIDPAGTNIITLIITTDSQGSGTFQFKIPQNSKFGIYQVIATSLASDINLKSLAQFTVSPSDVIFNN